MILWHILEYILRQYLWIWAQIYILGGVTVGDRDELIRLWGQEVNDQGQSHDETKCGQKTLWE